VLGRAGIAAADVEVFLVHQANKNLIDRVAQSLGVPADRFYCNIQRFGNTSSASMLIAAAEYFEDRPMTAKPVVFAAFGAGFHWGAVLVERRLLSDDLNQRAFLAPAVKLAVEDLLPRSEVELAAGDGDHHFASHHLPLHVRVRIVFAGAVVPVLRGRLVGREPFEPFLVIRVQARIHRR
jgi:hypothetical protein